MRHSSSSLEALHRLSSSNRDLIEGSRECGCFFCLETFEASEVKEWIPEQPGSEAVTAVCPRCGIDSVLPAREGKKVDKEILAAMRRYWFPNADGASTEGKPSVARAPSSPLLRRLTWDLWLSRKRFD